MKRKTKITLEFQIKYLHSTIDNIVNSAMISIKFKQDIKYEKFIKTGNR